MHILQMIKRNIVMVGAISLLVAGMFSIVLATNASAQVDLGTNLCDGAKINLGGTADSSQTCGSDPETNGGNRINGVVKTIINVLSMIIGIVAVIIIIIAGFRFITADGDSGKINSARSSIIYAVVGLIIVALAQFIVRFVLSKAT